MPGVKAAPWLQEAARLQLACPASQAGAQQAEGCQQTHAGACACLLHAKACQSWQAAWV